MTNIEKKALKFMREKYEEFSLAIHFGTYSKNLSIEYSAIRDFMTEVFGYDMDKIDRLEARWMTLLKKSYGEDWWKKW